MYGHDPRSFAAVPNFSQQSYVQPSYLQPNYAQPNYVQPWSNDLYTLQARVEELRAQCVAMTQQLRSEVYALGTQTRVAGAPTADVCPIRFRETEANLHADIYIPNLTAGDVEVEVSGNRICLQTRVPVAPTYRWLSPSAQLPRGFELFELPDGRIELSWLAPVPFNAKEVTASFRDGYLMITVPKTETISARHVVKIAKETGRRAANDMNS